MTKIKRKESKQFLQQRKNEKKMKAGTYNRKKTINRAKKWDAHWNKKQKR
jgi:hypothetical protein